MTAHWDGYGMVPRLQDLSRQQAFGHEARMILRSAPLLMPRSTSSRTRGIDYFQSLFDLVHLLCDVALGNVTLEDAKGKGRAFDQALHAADQFEEKSIRMVYAVLLATDALGDLGSVRYFENPGGPSHNLENPDAQMIMAESAEVVSSFGMKRETLYEPAQLDLEAITKERDETGPYVTPEFFARRLWPNEKAFSLKHEGMLAVFEVLLDDWENRLHEQHLSGVVTNYESYLNGMQLIQAQSLKRKVEARVVQNTVTINLGNGASFTGPVTLADTVQDSLNAAGPGESELEVKLRKFIQQVSPLIENLKDPQQKSEVSNTLKSFIDESKAPSPDKSKLQDYAGIIMKRAISAAEFITPVAESIAAVLKLVGGA